MIAFALSVGASRAASAHPVLHLEVTTPRRLGARLLAPPPPPPPSAVAVVFHRLEAVRRLTATTHIRALHLDGGIRFDGDAPGLCARLKLGDRQVELPTVELLPTHYGSVLAWEVRVGLLSGRF